MTLTEAVSDAIFMAVDIYGDPPAVGRQDCDTLATEALEAVRAQGWRIVKTGEDGIRHGSNPHVAIFEEWTG